MLPSAHNGLTIGPSGIELCSSQHDDDNHSTTSTTSTDTPGSHDSIKDEDDNNKGRPTVAGEEKEFQWPQLLVLYYAVIADNTTATLSNPFL